MDKTQSLRRFDGVKLHKLLVERGDKAVANPVKRLIDAYSARADIDGAKRKIDICVSLIKAGPKPSTGLVEQDPGIGEICGSLFAHAATLYTAVAVKNDARDPIPITQNWSDTELAQHERIRSLRNQYIAHFGRSSDHPHGKPSTDEMVIFLGEGGPSITHCYSRNNYKPGSIIDLERCLDRGGKAIVAIIADREVKLFEAFEKWCLAKPTDYFNTMLACEFFATDEGMSMMARNILPQMPSLNRSVITEWSPDGSLANEFKGGS